MTELTAKRLAVIRHLFEKGKALSFEGEPMNGLCLLPFHDSVEMFMKLCADEQGVQIPRNTMFMDYYTKLPQLQDKPQMDSLNSRRVSLKHHGQMPSSLDVEMTRVNVIDFFEHNTPLFFGCKLEDVSLEVLIAYPLVRDYLKKYHEYLDEGKYGDAQAQCQIAFKVFMVEYHKKYDRRFDLKSGPASVLESVKNPHLEDNTDKYLETLKEAVRGLNEAISVMSLGINYFKYSDFIAMGPVVNRWWGSPDGKYDYYVGMKERYDEATAKACYNFVVETALQLQGKNVFLY
jgi:hypothetical protein